jgi:predicted O-methyltransferase YrrM
VDDVVRDELVRLGGGDPFADVLGDAHAHQREHGCGLFPAGAAVMQLAAAFVRAAGARSVLDLGCGIGYSTFWLAEAAGPDGHVTAIDDDATHLDLARRHAARLGLDRRIDFVVGDVAEVLATFDGRVDAVHDDAWFATPPPHLERMLEILRPGGLLTMPNWFLLVDAITGAPRNDWRQWAGDTWAADTIAYAEHLAARPDIAVTWTTTPPLATATKHLPVAGALSNARRSRAGLAGDAR